MTNAVILWEQNAIKYGLKHGAIFSDKTLTPDTRLAACYYDGTYCYYRIGDYTGDKKWYDIAVAANKVYRDEYVIPNNGGVPGRWLFPHGLLQHYFRTGDTKSRDALNLIATNGAYASDQTPITPAGRPDDDLSLFYLSREVAFVGLTYLMAEKAGVPRRSRLAEIRTASQGHLRQWFSLNNASYMRPFMVALTCQFLIQDYEQVGSSDITLSLIGLACDLMWELWLPEAKCMSYTNVDTSKFSPTARDYGTGGLEAAPDLNLLIAPVYAWAYRRTGILSYLQRAWQLFEGGVGGAFLGNPKQFNQNYRWSFECMKWGVGLGLPSSVTVSTTGPVNVNVVRG